MNITFISDTHSKHKQVTDDLTGGDVLIHAGDISSMGYEHEVRAFLMWFNELRYDRKIFIAGNHDYFFEQQGEETKSKLLSEFPDITYLEDDYTLLGEEWEEDRLKVYGSPWQPKFWNWAFNKKRNSDEIAEKWSKIPDDTDILVTHGPPHGILDWVQRDFTNAGCERLISRVYNVEPLVHVFGHIHEQHGYRSENGTMFLNASVLNGSYYYNNKPVKIEIGKNRKVRLL